MSAAGRPACLAGNYITSGRRMQCPPARISCGFRAAHLAATLSLPRREVSAHREKTVRAFLAYASKEGAAFLDRTLYLPMRWTNDPVRRAEAGVPEELVFRNKIELAEEMLERAFAAAGPARWVVADSFYRRSHAFRVWLEERGHPYAVSPSYCVGPRRPSWRSSSAVKLVTSY
jgi:hypothetical protein